MNRESSLKVTLSYMVNF